MVGEAGDYVADVASLDGGHQAEEEDDSEGRFHCSLFEYWIPDCGRTAFLYPELRKNINLVSVNIRRVSLGNPIVYYN